MKIVLPTWRMRILCFCGDGSPILVVCPNCEYLTAFCDGIGDALVDPKDLDKGFTENCPSCQTETSKFILASSKQILKAGFVKEEYW